MTDDRAHHSAVLNTTAKAKSRAKTSAAEQAIRALVKRGQPITFQAVCREAGVSHGSTGDSHDNAMAEALNAMFKAELIHRFGPRQTRAKAEIAIYEWVSWYDNERLHTALGNVPPAEYEAAYHAATAAPGGAR